MTSSLLDEFDADHRVFTRGLARLHRALRGDDWGHVREVAESFDREVGGHLRFEAVDLFPRLRARCGDDTVDRLRAQLHAGRSLVQRLLAGPEPDADERLLLLDRLRELVDHATRCGTLFGRLVASDPGGSRELLARLRRQRRNAAGWCAGGPSPAGD